MVQSHTYVHLYALDLVIKTIRLEIFMKKCINCQAELADDALFCTECGLAVEITDADRDPVDEIPAEEVDAVQAAETFTDEAAEGNEAADEAIDFEDKSSKVIVDIDDSEASGSFEYTGEPTAPMEPKKNRWTGVTTLVVIIAAVVILGLAFFFLYSNGTLAKWYEDLRPKTKSSCTMEDYSEIPVNASDISYSEETVQSYITSTLGEDPTDETVQEYAATHSDCSATTVAEFEEYADNYVYSYYLHNNMMEYLKSITTVNSYDEVLEAQLIEYSTESLEYYASNYGISADSLASYYGYDDAASYATAQAHDYMTTAMIIDKVAKDQNITFSEEDLNASIQDYMNGAGYSDYYSSVEEFEEMVGETWVYLYENLTYKFDIVMAAIEPNVVINETTDTESSVEETTAAD